MVFLEIVLRRPMRRSGAVLATLIAAVLLSACGGSSSSAPKSSLTSAPTTSTTALSATDAAVIDGYRAYWDTFAAASNPMNPNDPRLAEHATGKALAQVRSSFLAYKSAGQVFKGGADLAPKVLSSTATSAEVQDCYLDHGVPYDANGKAQGAEDTQRQLVQATMTFEGGNWKVSAIDHKGSGCVAP